MHTCAFQNAFNPINQIVKKMWRQHSRQNDTQHNDSQYDITNVFSTQNNGTQDSETQHGILILLSLCCVSKLSLLC
jgi:hypothetical protein